MMPRNWTEARYSSSRRLCVIDSWSVLTGILFGILVSSFVSTQIMLELLQTHPASVCKSSMQGFYSLDDGRDLEETLKKAMVHFKIEHDRGEMRSDPLERGWDLLLEAP